MFYENSQNQSDIPELQQESQEVGFAKLEISDNEVARNW